MTGLDLLVCEDLADFKRTLWDAPIKAEIRRDDVSGGCYALLFDRYPRTTLIDSEDAPTARGCSPTARTQAFPDAAALRALLKAARVRDRDIYDFLT